MNRILVRIEDYKRYVEIHDSNRLDSKNEIFSKYYLPNFLDIKEEIFEGKITEYSIIEDNIDRILIKFKSKSETEYRIDLLKEPNINIWHIAFSLYDSNLDSDYDIRTHKDEPIDVFSRIIWILKDLDRNFEYCIGATATKKDAIYEYMMRYVSNWEKRNTNIYKLGWGLYFHL